MKNGQVKKSSRLARLNPFLDSDAYPPLIRVGGQIYRRGGDKNHPIVLLREKEIVPLLIHHEHEMLGHIGIEHIRTEMRGPVWIIQDKRALKGVVNRCIICRRRHGAPLSQQLAPLPEPRVVATQTWSITGVNYAGPFHVSNGRSRPKRWISLFTCLTFRAIHLEVVAGLDTDSFLNAFTRFHAHHPGVWQLVSDNGTNFRSADKELQITLKSYRDSLSSHVSMQGIEWKFLPPSAPHCGGIWDAWCVQSKRF